MTNQIAKVGEILVQAGVIDEMQLAAALGEQARWGRRLGVTLIKMGMVSEGHLIRALARQLNLPVASLTGKRIAADVIALVPTRVACEHGVIPLFTKESGHVMQLYLGMEDPSNLAVLDDLTFRTGMEVHPVMVGPTELGEAVDRYYLSKPDSKADTTPEPVRDAPSEAMGERSLRLVSETGAAQASFDAAIELREPVASLPDGLLDELAHAIEETEKTRIVTKAFAQLLIEKGILTLDEVQAQIDRLRGRESA